MTPERDPPRLSQEHSEMGRFLREAAGQAREDLPNPEALKRIFSQLPSGGSASGGTGGEAHKTTHGHSPTVAAHSGVGGSAAVGGLAGLVVCGVLWLSTPAWLDEPKPVQTSPSAVASALSSPTLSVSPERTELSGQDKLAPVDKAHGQVANGASKPVSTGEIPIAAPSETSTSSADAPAQEPGESEASLLARAQGQIQLNGNAALALCEEHRVKFPKGVLGQEREVIAISALVALGRVPEARARAKVMITANPNSAYVRRLSVIVPELESADSAGLQ
ncbi:MAG: hypothetical protein IPK82_31585 [Polyangiaceae bacterium]|nr:hypothetical protein [Polyangiaceae bacterium]